MRQANDPQIPLIKDILQDGLRRAYDQGRAQDTSFYCPTEVHTVTQAFETAGYVILWKPKAATSIAREAVDLAPSGAAPEFSGPEDIVAASIARGAIDGRRRSAEERAAEITAALREAGYEIRPQEADSRRRYEEALAIVRGSIATVGFVAEVLGTASPDGPEGNVWHLLDAKYAEFIE